jgi:hypothetical protein
MTAPATNPAESTPKRSLLQKILIAIGVPPLVLALIIMVQPTDFRVSRSAVVSGPPELVFEHVNDLQKWQLWSPWAEMDPNAKIAFTEKVAGKDAAFTWSGNNEIGEGTLTITDSRPSELVQYRLEFRKPFVGTSNAKFELKPEADKTHVTWIMEGKNDFIGKAVSLVMDCDKEVGGQFEEGLKNLDKVVVQAQAKE